MARVTIEDCLEKVNNRFVLIHMASKRTKMLLEGDEALVNYPKNKEGTVALREIANGKVTMSEQATKRRSARNLSGRRKIRRKG